MAKISCQAKIAYTLVFPAKQRARLWRRLALNIGRLYNICFNQFYLISYWSKLKTEETLPHPQVFIGTRT